MVWSLHLISLVTVKIFYTWYFSIILGGGGGGGGAGDFLGFQKSNVLWFLMKTLSHHFINISVYIQVVAFVLVNVCVCVFGGGGGGGSMAMLLTIGAMYAFTGIFSMCMKLHVQEGQMLMEWCHVP